MKKIGIVINSPLSYSLTFIVNELELLKNIGFEVILFTSYTPQSPLIRSDIKVVQGLPIGKWSLPKLLYVVKILIRLIFIGLKPLFRFLILEGENTDSYLRKAKKLYKVAHMLPYNLDFLHFGFANVALHKENLAKALNAKMSISIRGADIAILPIGNPGIYSNVWKNSDKVRVISNDLYQKAIQYGLDEKSPQNLIYQTLNLENISSPERSGKLHSPLRILTVARLHWKKGLEYSLAALAQLKKSGIDFQYIIAGSGEHEQAIKYNIEDFGLNKQVILKGSISYPEVISLMNESDIYIQPSIQEGFCNAVLEAQFCRLMIIAADAEGIKENIVHENTGWIVSKRNALEITQRIIKVIELSDEERKQIGINAHKRVQDNFFLDRYKKQWFSFFS